MLRLRQEAKKKAAAPADLQEAARARGLAEVDLVKADLAYRTAHVELAAGPPDLPPGDGPQGDSQSPGAGEPHEGGV